MKMAAVGADWSKRLIKTREGEGEGGWGDSREEGGGREGGGKERNQHRPRL